MTSTARLIAGAVRTGNGTTRMRRFLLALTVLSFSAWSQPAQQQAQLPIVVQVQMPPTNPSWMHLVELVVPGIIGAGLALFGVWLTNKHNAATNAANRKHELEKLSLDHSFGLKRDVLLRVTQTLVQTLTALKEWDSCRACLEHVENNGEEEYGQLKQAQEDTEKAWAEYSLRRNELEQATASACLALSDELWKSAQAVKASIVETRNRIVADGIEYNTTPIKTVAQLFAEIADFTKAAKTELGIMHITGE